MVVLIPSRIDNSLKHYISKKQREGTDTLDVERLKFVSHAHANQLIISIGKQALIFQFQGVREWKTLILYKP